MSPQFNKNNVVEVIKSLFSFKGKMNRKKFFFVFLIIIIAAFIVAVINVSAVLFVFYIIVIPFHACNTVKRLHDLNRPGWHYWLSLIPIYNIYFAIVLFTRKGIVGDNTLRTDQSNEKIFTRTKIVLFFITLATIFFIILITIGLIYEQPDIPLNYVVSESKNSSAKGTTVPNITISNPEYLRSPNDFLVDRTNLVSSKMPMDKPVWVEKVINENTIRVSYIIETEGQKIVKIKSLDIAYLDSYKNYDNQVFRDMLKGRLYDLHVDGNSHVDCMRKLTTDVLENMVKERYVYLQLVSTSKGLEGPHFAVISDEVDVGQTLIKNGFGIVGTKLSGVPVYGTDYDLVEKILEANRQGTIVHDPAFWAVTVDDGPYLQKLVSQQQLARLANVGIWSECSYTKFPLIIKF